MEQKLENLFRRNLKKIKNYLFYCYAKNKKIVVEIVVDLHQPNDAIRIY